MPVYSYKALRPDGNVDQGVVDADSPKEARLKLRGRQLHVTDLSVLEEGGEKGGGRGRGGKVKSLHLAVVSRQLGTLLRSGIPLMGALTAVIDQAEHPRMKSVLMDVRERVSRGENFSAALEVHPRVFTRLIVSMVRAGEASGTLDNVMFRLAEYLHQQARVRERIIAALTYPAIMALVGAVVVFFLLAFVVPRIIDVLQKQGKEALPLPTEILLLISGFFSGYWWLILTVLVAGGMLFGRTIRTPGGRLWWDTFRLRVPVVGPLLRKAAVSRFCITFSTLLESGLSVLDSLRVVREVMQNEMLANAIDDVRGKISEGADIATPMKQSKVFPPVVGYMIAVGEESGRLEELLGQVSEAYDSEVEIATQKLTSLLEPIMIVVLAVIVGFVVLSILLPIFEMSNL